MSERDYLRHRTRLGLMLALGVAGCGADGGPPSLDAVDDQLAVVGEELVINLRATDPDGDAIDFEFGAPDPTIAADAMLTRRPDGTAVFRWTPLADNVGSLFFDFHATDDDGRDTITVLVEVGQTGGEGSAPVFREPLGSGTTLDLATAACLDVPIVVEDPNDAEVELSTTPGLDGAALDQDSGTTGVWSWCPTEAQLDEDRYPVTFAADDGNQAPTLKNYLVVLRAVPKADCPGDAPVIEHAPTDVETILDLDIVAEVSDDQGLAREPLLYFSSEAPADPVDFSALDVVEMTLTSGDMTQGTWSGRVPNPVATGSDGDSATVHYIISAKDNDDADGSCDHLVDAPDSGAFRMTVTHGGSGGAAACDPCSADVQCGGDSDLCVVLDGDEVCATACTEGSCGAGHSCSEVTSVDGATTDQCVPVSGMCGPIAPQCRDDAEEDNDDQASAATVSEGSSDLVSCAGRDVDDEDWFEFDVPEGTLTVSIAGGGTTNLQLGLYDDAGDPIAVSEGAGSDETVEACLPAGVYAARVHTFDTGENPYTLTWGHAATTCDAGTCEDDDLEQDDSQAAATYGEVFPDPFEVVDRMICSGDDDFYRVELFDGETLQVDLTFTQATDDEDLDLHFFDPDGVDLTPCDEAMPGTCSAAQGQSVTSNETYSYTVDDGSCAPCSFWISVHGWDGAENGYDLTLALQ